MILVLIFEIITLSEGPSYLHSYAILKESAAKSATLFDSMVRDMSRLRTDSEMGGLLLCIKL